jgi:predicted Zn-dependent protease
MPELARNERLHLQTAEIWLELDNCARASEELKGISHQMRVHPEVLRVRYEMCVLAHQWEQAASVAQAMCQVMPRSSLGWIRLAEALHGMKRTRQAWEVLLSVAERFPDEPGLAYSLACYACKLGELKAGWEWLERMLQLSKTSEAKKTVLEDPNLRPLWEGSASGNR